MCIIAIQPLGVKINKQTLKNCWQSNNDGAGLMYIENGKIVVKRELESFDKFMKLKKYADSLNTNIVIHFRIATSGGINERNIHPFKINNDLYFCHNGILDIEVPVNSPINDTQIFNNCFMKGLPSEFQYNDSIMRLIEFTIGERNKFVFFDSLGNFHILNENKGIWDGGAWYSNGSYKNMSSFCHYTPNKAWAKLNDENDSYFTCESCNELHDIESMRYDDYFDMYFCENCTDSLMATKD